MKKYLFVFTVFALLQVSCSSDDNEPDVKEDTVFQESQFLGNWRRIATQNGEDWIHDAETCLDAFIAFKEKNVLEEFDCSYLMTGNGWTFDGKNVLKFETKDGTRYQLNLKRINEREGLIADAYLVSKDGVEKKAIWMYEKKDFDLGNYYDMHTGSYKVKDITDFIRMGINPDLRIVTGLKDDKLWIGYFDENREQIYEIKAKEDFNLTKEIYMGYGEHKTCTVTGLNVVNSCDKSVFELKWYLRDEEGNNVPDQYTLWFSQNGKYIDEKKSAYRLISWYNDSYLVDMYDSLACYSTEGELLLNNDKSSLEQYRDIEFYPINYNYYIATYPQNACLSVISSRLFNDGNNSWNDGSARIETETADFKYTVALVEKNEQNWIFKIDITEYSGKQHSHIVEMNVSGVK